MSNTYKLLIIEDDKGMCEMLSNLLNKWEFEVNVCENFEKIIEYFLRCNLMLFLWILIFLFVMDFIGVKR